MATPRRRRHESARQQHPRSRCSQPVREVVVLGAGPTGLTTALLLARAGYAVTVLDRDAAEPGTTADQAWGDWSRPGVNQFRQVHVALPRWYRVMQEELPDVGDTLLALGGRSVNQLHLHPASATGGHQDGDEQFDTVTGRRPVIEAALASVAAAQPGLTVRRGVRVTGLVTTTGADGSRRIGGVRTEARGDRGRPGGRRHRSPHPGAGLAGSARARPGRTPGDGRPHLLHAALLVPRRTSDGYGRRPDAPPVVLGADPAGRQRHLGSGDHRRLDGLTRPGGCGSRRAGRPPSARAGSTSAGWPGRRSTTYGLSRDCRTSCGSTPPTACRWWTGCVAVGDAWATTSPFLGRGLSLGALQAVALRDAVAGARVGGLGPGRDRVRGPAAGAGGAVRPGHHRVRPTPGRRDGGGGRRPAVPHRRPGLGRQHRPDRGRSGRSRAAAGVHADRLPAGPAGRGVRRSRDQGPRRAVVRLVALPAGPPGTRRPDRRPRPPSSLSYTTPTPLQGALS